MSSAGGVCKPSLSGASRYCGGICKWKDVSGDKFEESKVLRRASDRAFVSVAVDSGWGQLKFEVGVEKRDS